MIIKGFKFGILLQIAIGPICLFVFQTAVTHGFWAALYSVIGVALVDALFILVAIWGIGTLLEHNKQFKKIIQTFGAIVLIGFGISTLLSAFGISILPSMNFLPTQNFNSIFFKALLLTLSNPMTILFWAGVFSTKIVEDDMNTSGMYLFGLGAVISTLLFLSLISGIGVFANEFFPSILLTSFNILIGLLLIAFGIKTASLSVVKST